MQPAAIISPGHGKPRVFLAIHQTQDPYVSLSTSAVADGLCIAAMCRDKAPCVSHVSAASLGSWLAGAVAVAKPAHRCRDTRLVGSNLKQRLAAASCGGRSRRFRQTGAGRPPAHSAPHLGAALLPNLANLAKGWQLHGRTQALCHDGMMMADARCRAAGSSSVAE